MKLIPIDDRVLVQRLVNKEQKIGSIYVPDSAKEKPMMGEVLEVGNDDELGELVKKGDKVLFAKYSGSEFELDGQELLILQRTDLLGKLVD